MQSTVSFLCNTKTIVAWQCSGCCVHLEQSYLDTGYILAVSPNHHAICARGVEIEYFEGGFTLKYKTCPYYKVVKKGQQTWLCNFRKRVIEYVASRVTHGGKSKIKIIKSLLKNEHPCEYAVFLKEFLE